MHVLHDHPRSLFDILEAEHVKKLRGGQPFCTDRLPVFQKHKGRDVESSPIGDDGGTGQRRGMICRVVLGKDCPDEGFFSGIHAE